MGKPIARAVAGDATSHGPPLAPGPGSLNVLAGNMPVWRALPTGAGAALQAAQQAADVAVKAAETATKAAMGTPGAPAALAAETAAKTAATAAMTSAMSAAASASTGVAAAMGSKPGMSDTHLCTVPLVAPVPAPHGPGMVIDGSTTVMCNGLPVSRQGDTLIEALGGPDKIAMALTTVLVGG
ncbi:hypothetical protein [Terrarubrum flagellatum]|uniref:hypothetical protein n=1 Tax=Terrirubrum flagellatum TaxID=2895980 RepID=UPI003144D776